ncbi:MAG: hydantoinase/oxoprolinase family protein, partial [Alphaproteobacteria bacterium]|nr:hydantoinase/oxoprolinase family protein [Alphaproteobacteria bacterium]
RGGTEPTVSDANLVLGRLPDSLIGGAMTLDVALASAAIQPAADRLGFTVEKTAHGILGIVVANMVRAVRTISVERGHDPRDFSLMAFGGAGALHAGDVARELEMREIIVPPAPGILCAQGLVVSDLKEDFVTTRRLPYNDDALIAMANDLAGLRARAEAWFADENVTAGDRSLRIAFDMRYVRQNFELTVPWVEIEGDDMPDMASLDILRGRFYELHERTYGHYTETDPIEIVNIRLAAVGRTAPKQKASPASRSETPPSSTGSRAVWFEAETAVETPVYERSTLLAGHTIRGPAVVEQLDALTIIHPGDLAKVDGHGNLIIDVGA